MSPARSFSGRDHSPVMRRRVVCTPTPAGAKRWNCTSAAVLLAGTMRPMRGVGIQWLLLRQHRDERLEIFRIRFERARRHARDQLHDLVVEGRRDADLTALV